MLSALNKDIDKLYQYYKAKGVCRNEMEIIGKCDELGISYLVSLIGSGFDKNGPIPSAVYYTDECPEEFRGLIENTKAATLTYFNAGIQVNEELTPEIQRSLTEQQIKDECNRILLEPKFLYKKTLKILHRALENRVRVDKGLPQIGQGWVQETLLYRIVESLLPEYEINFHYRGKELNGLELDIWLPDRKMGMEYQGEQHFHPIEHFGGKKGFRDRQKNDKRKAELCKELGYQLIYFTYKDELTPELVADRIM